MEREKEFYTNPSDFDKKEHHNRLALLTLKETTNSNRLSLAHLLEHGMNAAPQTSLNLTHPGFAELLKYVEENF